MSNGRLAVTSGSDDLARLLGGRSLVGLSDGELLARFVANRDEGAFEGLVARLGPMVLGVCRRMLSDRGDDRLRDRPLARKLSPVGGPLRRRRRDPRRGRRPPRLDPEHGPRPTRPGQGQAPSGPHPGRPAPLSCRVWRCRRAAAGPGAQKESQWRTPGRPRPALSRVSARGVPSSAARPTRGSAAHLQSLWGSGTAG